ncbi:MAG: endonuclease [Muribaculaceae bacterium]|nr:endonuclease [Muribaculaceae bacterium]
MKRLLPLFVLLLAFAASAAIPKGYYSSLNAKKNGDLKTAARNIIYDHTPVSSYNSLPNYFKKTDKKTIGSTDYWWDMYSSTMRKISDGFSGLNREHSFPKSWWGGDTETPAYTDLNHLYPGDGSANQSKSNWPLGVVQSATFDNGVSKIGTPVSGQGGGASKVYEPADEYKGDFARTYFYMATCYQDLEWSYTYMVSNNLYPTLNTWAINLLLKWHRDDPVSQKEINRNEVVYSYQNNRNPFIDYPDLAEYIWGSHKGELFYTDGPTPGPEDQPNLITPTQGTTLDFGEVAIGSSVTRQLFFKGEHLTGSLSLSLTGTNKAMFSLSSTSIAAELVNAADGYKLNITYSPTALGDHTAKVLVYDGGITGSRGIVLNGSCKEVPSLSAIVALDATDITDESYVANWEASTDEIDAYVVTRTRYVNGSAQVEEIEVDPSETSLAIADFNESTEETYSVQTERLGFRSPASNLITVAHDGVERIEGELPLGVAVFPDCIRFICGATIHTGARIYDPSGRLIYYIPVIENNMEINLPFGVYFITTDRLSRPLKIAVK